MIQFVVLLLIPQVVYGSSFSDSFINKEIKSFFENPKEYYQKPIIRIGKRTPLYTSSLEKAKVRDAIILNESKSSQKSVIRSNDRASRLFHDISIEKNIYKLNSMDISSGITNISPWSGDYWPIFKGVLGARYGDENFEYLDSWKDSYKFIQAHSAFSLFRTGDSLEINKLSPSEKFDFLIGKKMNLSDNLWAQGERYAQRSESGIVEAWMGICHGWAPASYMVPRPKHAIDVIAYDGVTSIKFYPSDLKALASLLWASTSYPTNFIGGRCRSSNPARDSMGRIIDEDCLDSNPATFFLSTLNGVGIHGKSFVIDVTHDYEVWNQPIKSYRYTLFNPVDQNTVKDLEQGIIDISDYKNDPFKKYRTPGTKYIVGVSMEVTYGVETSPLHAETDAEELDEYGSIYLMFDLELDEKFNIIGGEWYRGSFPDFLWKPSEEANAYTRQDYYVLSRPLWNGNSQIDSDIKKLATAAAREGSPLAYIVNSLIQLAQ